MSKDEGQKNDEIPSSNGSLRASPVRLDQSIPGLGYSKFGFWHSFGFRHSGFVIGKIIPAGAGRPPAAVGQADFAR
jgi:hypothetical protein